MARLLENYCCLQAVVVVPACLMLVGAILDICNEITRTILDSKLPIVTDLLTTSRRSTRNN